MKALLLLLLLLSACSEPPCAQARGLQSGAGHDREQALLPPGGKVCGFAPGLGLMADYKSDPHPLFLAAVHRTEADGWKRAQQKIIDEMGAGSLSLERRTLKGKTESALVMIGRLPENKSVTRVTVKVSEY
jgi:hypothetical protein